MILLQFAFCAKNASIYQSEYSNGTKKKERKKTTKEIEIENWEERSICS
jgi:hypothetical protein